MWFHHTNSTSRGSCKDSCTLHTVLYGLSVVLAVHVMGLTELHMTQKTIGLVFFGYIYYFVSDMDFSDFVE